MEIGNLPETKFKIMLVKMIQNTEKTREDPKNVYQNLQKLKNRQMNNTQEEINNRITEAEAWTKDMEDRMVEITAREQNIEKRMKRNENSLRGLWDNIKYTSIIGVQEEERKDLRKYLKRQ